MIVTLTPNPSIDATIALDSPLTPGTVHRAASMTNAAGGKGINVAHAVTLAGKSAVAVIPAAENDPFISLVNDINVDISTVEIAENIRTNTTVTETSGRTTKLNGKGPAVDSQAQSQLIDATCHAAANASWVVMAGSLPNAVPVDFYVTAINALRKSAPQVKIALDTSDKPMEEIAKNLSTAAPDLIKPNGLELGQLVGEDGLALEAAAEGGDYSGVIAAARKVNAQGVGNVLVTLGAAGALLVTETGAWTASPPPIEVASTVGAGDSSLAGFLLAQEAGNDLAESLRYSVAYGSAATSLPGTTIPTPDILNLAETNVRQLN